MCDKQTVSRPIHPACAIWPRPSDEDVLALAEDIRVNGLIDPVWLMPDGSIIDGKTRYEACQLAGIEPHFKTYEGNDPEVFTISCNKYRRHMSKPELANIVEELATLSQGGDRRSANFKLDVSSLKSSDKTMEKLAKRAGIGHDSVLALRTIKEKGTANVKEAVRLGKVGMINAALYAKYTPQEVQQEASIETIRKVGAALRTPNKLNPSQKELPLEIPGVVGIHTLVNELVPLFTKVMSQAKRHPAMVSQSELAMIAARGQRLLDKWASGDYTVRRVGGHVVPPKHLVSKNDDSTLDPDIQ
jgi:hypothetical protein